MNRKSAIKNKYVKTVQIGDEWNTYLQIDHQGFCIVDNTTKKRAEWFANQLATALHRLIAKNLNK